METPVDKAPERSVVTFIRDVPADEDFFSTHTRLAHAIVDSIRSNEEIKVVGLLGRWGSGKSTVAKMLIEIMAEDEGRGFRVFTYDAWLHQSDPLRRSFLESLLRALVEANAIQPGKWSNKLKELNGQIEDAEVIEAPSLSADARWIGLSLLPVPIGVGLLDLDTIKEAFGENATWLGLSTFLVALAFLLMPGLVWLARYLTRREWKTTWYTSKKRYFSKAFWTVFDEEGSPTAALRIFTNHSVKRANTRTVRSGEPSSLEFGRVFQEIMREATTDKKRFVILIDNLDRIAEEEALQMWATIRSFFLASHGTEDFKHESFHPTVILPIDRHAIEQLFATSPDGSGSERARSFIDKTFDVTFEVTQPVSSDWRAFLEQQMERVFGADYRESWGFWTRRLFEQSLPETQVIVTPREINKLLNRVAALYVQWRDQGITVEVMALYVIRQDTIHRDLLAFLQSNQGEFNRLSPDWQREIAALYFGVPIEKAAQVVLERPIERAIVDFDRESFARLSNIPGFADTFEFATARLSAPEGRNPFEVVSNAALLLDTINDRAGEWQAMAWRNLVERYLTSDSEFGPSDDLAKRLHLLGDHVEPSVLEEFLKITSKGLGRLMTMDHSRTQHLTAVCSAATHLVEFADKHQIDPPEFWLDVEPNIFVRKFAGLTFYSKVWPQVRTNLGGAELTEGIIAMLRDVKQQSKAATAVRYLGDSSLQDIHAGEDLLDWNAVTEVATEIVRSPGNYGVVASPAIRVLMSLSKPESLARTRLLEVIDDQTLAFHLSEAVGQKEWNGVALIVAVLMWRNREFALPAGTSWDAVLKAKPDIPKLIIDEVRRYYPNAVMRVLWNAQAVNIYPTKDFVEVLIGHFVDAGNLGSFDPGEVIKNLSRYRYAVPWRQRDRFLELVNRRADLLTAIETEPLGPPIVEAAKYLQAKGGDTAQRAKAIMRRRVEEADVDAWVVAINQGKEPYGLIAQFGPDEQPRFGRKSNLCEALSMTIPTLVGTASRDVRARWFELSQLLKSDAQTKVMGELADMLRDASADQALHLLKVGGARLLKQGGFAKQADRSVETVILPQLQSKDGRDWLKDHDEMLHGWLQRAGPDRRENAREALIKLSQSKLEERSYSAKLLMERWELEKAFS